MSKRPLVSIVAHFEELPDPRQDRNKQHKLIDLIVIAICAVICGCESFPEIALYGEKRKEWFRQFLELPNGIPSHDTFWRVLQRIKPAAFQACFARWVASLRDATGGQIIAIDGKTLRRSHDRAAGQDPLHLVSAWAAENHLALGQVAVDGKSNEITAIPKLLELIDVTGGIVTIDAMGCQREIATQIRAQGADYVLAVKENQPHLYEDISAYLAQQMENDFADVRCSRYATQERGHGRAEERFYYHLDVPAGLRNREAWCELRTIGMVVSLRTVNGQEQADVRYYLSSLRRNARQFAQAVRGHWGIENSLHWVLDVTFDEDQCRVHKGHGAENLAWIRRFAVSLLKRHPADHSIRSKRLAAALDNDFLLEVLTGDGS
jgi:predicted transposase YbfD/YdcC